MSAEDLERRMALGRRIDQVRRAKGLSCVLLGEKAGYDERTVRNVIKGQSTRISTLSAICQVLEIEIDAKEDEHQPAAADINRGGYSLAQFGDYVGLHFGYRYSFSRDGTILKSLFEIKWSTDKKCLIFQEWQNYINPDGRQRNFSQAGDIYVSAKVDIVNLLTISEGSVRLISLAKTRMDDRTMNGIVLTPSQQAYFFQPAASPFFMRKVDGEHGKEALAAMVGVVARTDPEFEALDRQLQFARKTISLFVCD